VDAQITVVGDECTLVDEGLSRNGSFVNGERVGGRRRLRDGDTLQFGQTGVLFRAPAQSGASETVMSADALTAAGVSPRRSGCWSRCADRSRAAAFATPSTNGDIAAELHLSVGAVKTHLRALFERFGVEDLPQNQKRVALVERALQSGLVNERDL
jgi:FHA domain